MKTGLKLLVLFTVTMFIFMTSSIWADPIEDAYFTPADYNLTCAIGDYEGDNYSYAQSFLVGTAGYLASIEVPLGLGVSTGSDQLIFNLRTTSGGVPTSTSLAQVAIPHTDVPYSLTWMSFDISPDNVLVAPGEVYAIQFSLEGGSGVVWAGRLGDSLYPDGGSSENSGSGWIYRANYDLAFKTFIEPGNVIPEPSTFILFGTGLGALGLIAYRRRKK